MNAEQEKALREYLQEAIVPLIEQVLVKKLGQAMSFAAEQLIQPNREWKGLTEAERVDIIDIEITSPDTEHFALAQSIEAKLKEKNT